MISPTYNKHAQENTAAHAQLHDSQSHSTSTNRETYDDNHRHILQSWLAHRRRFLSRRLCDPGVGSRPDINQGITTKKSARETQTRHPPILSLRPAKRPSWSFSSPRSNPPEACSPMVTTSAQLSRQGSRLEWCSNGPTNTTGLFTTCNQRTGTEKQQE